MEKEKKGLFGRLLAFWREKTEEKTDGIGFWSGERAEKQSLTEKMQDGLPQEKAEKKAFWEETIQKAAEQKAEEQGLLQKEQRQAFAEGETEKEKKAVPAEKEEVQEKRAVSEIFTAEIFREERERRTETERRKTVFLREMPLEEKKKRRIVPVAEESRSAEKEKAEKEQELPQEEPKKEREQPKGAGIDIERLMREMTKRLWEERETSGRRLRR